MALLVAAGCTKHVVSMPPPAALLTPPTRLCGRNEGYPECRSAGEIEALLTGPLEILGMDDVPGSTQGAKVLTLLAHDRRGMAVLRAKWRALSTGGLFNEPRKELAAYAVQKLFLDEDELVVPPTVAYCFGGPEYRRFVHDAKPSLPGVDCVLGFLSYWLEDARTVGEARDAGWLRPGQGLWDAQRFESDRAYRESTSSANLLTYLIHLVDAHEGQFVLQSSPRGLRAFVIDCSIAFRSLENPVRIFRQDWTDLLVPAFSPKAISRLQRLTEADYGRLDNVAELELRSGTVVYTSPATRMPSDGTAMTWNGSHLRIGLTRGEIELVASRTRELLKRPDLERRMHD